MTGPQYYPMTLNAVTLACNQKTNRHPVMSLSDGEVKGTRVTCPNHGSQFDLATGEPRSGPASRALRRYDVRIEGDDVFVSPRT